MDLEAPALTGISDKARKTARRYTGATAADYERRRSGTRKWAAEERVLRAFLEDAVPGMTVLDVPCGTGRFFPLFRELGLFVLGLDASIDMLRQARERLELAHAIAQPGNIFALDIADRSFDIAVAIRIMNLIEEPDMCRALVELQRVARRKIIFNLRVGRRGEGRWHSPQRVEMVEMSLAPGWSLARNEEIHEPDFRMIELALRCGLAAARDRRGRSRLSRIVA